MGFSPYRVSSIYIYTSVDPPHIHVAGFPFVVQRICRAVGLVGGIVLEGRQNFDHNAVRTLLGEVPAEVRQESVEK